MICPLYRSWCGFVVDVQVCSVGENSNVPRSASSALAETAVDFWNARRRLIPGRPHSDDEHSAAAHGSGGPPGRSV